MTAIIIILSIALAVMLILFALQTKEMGNIAKQLHAHNSAQTA